MIIRYIIILGVSFIMEGILSIWLPFNFLLTLMALVYICIFSKFRTTTLIKISAVVGFIYDIVYMHTCFINMLMFILITYYLTRIDVQKSWKQAIIMGTITIIWYIVSLYIFVVYSYHMMFDGYILFKSIVIACLNIIYLLLLLMLFNRSKQRKISIYSYR